MDLIQREGRYPLPPGASNILGVEFAGDVAGLGDGVTQWKEGDSVFGLATGVRSFFSYTPSMSASLIIINPRTGRIRGIYCLACYQHHSKAVFVDICGGRRHP